MKNSVNSDSNNYFYDASGERTVKESSDGEGIQINGVLSGARTGTTNFTAYISPYLALNTGGYYTKHIFMGSQRIVSKLGSSDIFSTNPTDMSLTKAGNKDFTAKYSLLTGKIKNRFDSLGVVYNGMQQGNAGMITSTAGKIPTPLKYYFHSNHLGSSNVITDATGGVVQHLEYTPSGEVLVDERQTQSSWSTPYKFNGKELDEETGLYYYGARYYDPRTSVWISVDPLAEMYPNISSYVYCDDNPVKYIDPDGRQTMTAPPLGIIQYLSIAKTLEHTEGNQNARQIGYAMQRPSIANHVKNDLGVVAGNFQLNIGKAIGAFKNEEGTPQNAIRHTLWLALSARDLGSKEAERAANSHETTTNVDLGKRNFTGNNASDNADRTIDLLNNIIGRRIGEDNKRVDNKTMAIKVIDEYHDNGLWTMSGNDKTGYTIQKTKLTDAQYKAAINEINKKGNDGLNKKK